MRLSLYRKRKHFDIVKNKINDEIKIDNSFFSLSNNKN